MTTIEELRTLVASGDCEDVLLPVDDVTALLDVVEAARGMRRSCECTVESGCPEARQWEVLREALARLETR